MATITLLKPIKLTHTQDKGRTMHMPQLAQILKDSEYRLELFSEESIANLEATIIVKNTNGGGEISKIIMPLV